MKKLEFIEKYGEAAWEKKKEQTKEWRKKHPEAVKRLYLEWKEKNPEARKKIAREWARRNKDKVNSTTRKWQSENRERKNENQRNWYGKNRERAKKQYVTYSGTQNGRAAILLHAYRQSDKNAGRGECTITRDWIVERIFTSSCIYCGDSDWKHLGCERIDNSLPHTPDNCICACGVCNAERQCKDMEIDEFKVFRKTHPRGWDSIDNLKPDIVEINGTKVLRKKSLNAHNM